MTQVIGKMKLLKWWMPLLLVASLVAAGGLAWSQSGSGGVFDTSNLPQITDANPAYDDEIVAPSEIVLPAVLYSITMDPQTSVIPLGGGDITTIVVTNLIGEPIPLGPYGQTMDSDVTSPTFGTLVPINSMAYGDITGDVVVTADVYNTINVLGCLATYNSNTGVGESFTPTDGLPSAQVVVKIMQDITIHPGGTVSFIVPVIPGKSAVAGAEFLLKAAMYLPNTFGTADQKAWTPGYFTYNGMAAPGYSKNSALLMTPGLTGVVLFGP